MMEEPASGGSRAGCRILRYPSRLDPIDRGGVATIGNFDGVHRGHQRLLEVVAGVPGVGTRTVVSFYPHPLQVLRPNEGIQYLSTIREKRERLRACGVDLLYLVRFTPRVAEMSAEEFVARVLVEALGVRTVVLGEDAAIGRGRQGTVTALRGYLAAHGVDLVVVPHLVLGAVRPSSRVIRGLVQAGDVRGAATLLGEPFSVCGRVVRGDGRGGAVVGFATANLATSGRLLPACGVYACRVALDNRSYHGVANIGRRPTFDGVGERLEVHLLEWSGGPLYGRRLEVAFIERIREERRCASLQELRQLIASDVVRARKILIEGDLRSL